MAEIIRPPIKILPSSIILLLGFLIGLAIAYAYTH
jgi:hypothetical protein